MFVVIEWIDWSGKATQVALLKDKLENLWKKVKILDYPRYDKESSYFIKRYLNWDFWDSINPKQSAIFFALDRFEDFLENKEKFEKYDYIISNRYVSASMIHLASKIEDIEKRKKFILWLEDLEYNIFWISKPDKVLFLDISLENSKSLLLKKEKRNYIKSENNKDIHEKDDKHLRGALLLWRELCKDRENRFRIDCEEDWDLLSVEEINRKLLKYFL